MESPSELVQERQKALIMVAPKGMKEATSVV